MPEPDRLAIALVTPYTWGTADEVNAQIERSAAELTRRGHRVVIVAPGSSRRGIGASRKAISKAGPKGGSIFGGSEVTVLTVGQAIPLPRGPKPRAAPIPTNVSSTLEELFTRVEFDVVHVHDPFAPSVSSAALRHSRSLNVGSFHEPTERILSTQVARPLVEIFFGRLDARIVSGAATGELMRRYFAGRYAEIRGGAERRGEGRWPLDRAQASGAHPTRIVYCAREERGALRIALRGLRRLSLDLDWEATILLEDLSVSPPRLSRRLAERVTILRPGKLDAGELVAAADVVLATSGGPRAAPSLIREALVAGAVPVASQLERYEELIGDDAGLLFAAGDELTLAAQLERLVTDSTLRKRMAKRAAAAARTWEDVADDLERVYAGVCARRHDPPERPAVRRRLAERPMIDCDLHVHTDHSNDCATPAEVLVETARDRGMGAIAVTDHNEISGAFAARDYAAEVGGIRVIVAEEVKTAEQGEVIGLFLSEKIERGMTMAETIAEIRRQGGLVYVPHPFDRLHSVPDYEHLLEIVEEIDVLEVFNPRVAVSAFNEEAERFAAKYRIVSGAGSDGHVAQALGSVRIRLRDFEGPEEFLESMRDADIVRKHKNLVYVQALKQLQTAGGRGGARRSVSSPSPVRGGKARA